jgi:hypothetical protein
MPEKSTSLKIQNQLRCDVAVVGGGTTGITAAIAAARQGADTLLIEKNGCLGGNSTAIPAWLGFHSCDGAITVDGLPMELLGNLQSKGGATEFRPDPICGSVVGINTHWWKIVAAKAVREAKVKTLLHCHAFGLRKTDRNIETLHVLGSEGVIEVKASKVIDCTDNGLVAKLAGEQLVRGRAADNRVQVSSWVFEVDHVDFQELFRYLEQFPEDLRPFKLADPGAHLKSLAGTDVFVMGAFARLIRQARKDGIELPRDNMPGVAFPREGKMMSVACRIENVDTQNSASRTQAELDGAIQAEQWLQFLTGYVPGFRNCRLSGSPQSIGVRETNHLQGRYILTASDLLTGIEFEDAIALGGYHLDIHSPDHAGLETQRPPVYTIPYRALLPRETDNLIVAGRAISATHEAQSSTRVIPIGMALGEAAGTAAAMAVARRCSLPELDAHALRQTLRTNGALVDKEAQP